MLFELSLFKWSYSFQSLKVVPTTPVRTMEHVTMGGRETMSTGGRETMSTVAVDVDGMVITVS